jgi:serine protease Do
MTRSLSRAAAGVLAATLTIGAAVLGAAPAYADGTVGVASPAPPTVTPTAKAVAQARPAIVRVTIKVSGYVVDEKGQTLNNNQPYTEAISCTGFGVDPNGYVATAGHCADGVTVDGFPLDLVKAAAADVAAANPTMTQDQLIAAVNQWRVHGSTGDFSAVDMDFTVTTGSTTAGPAPQDRPARLVADKPASQGDVALLKIDASNLPTLQLAGDEDPAIGTPLLAIGFPGTVDRSVDKSEEPSNKDGQISSRKTINGLPFYEISAAVSPGMSGGPVVGMDGRVIGLNSWHPATETQQINFAAPANGLATVMREQGVKGGPGPNDLLFRSALDDFYAGHYSSSIASLDKLLASDSGHAQAIALRAKAADSKQRFGDVPVAQAPAPSNLPFGVTPLVFYSAIGGAGLLVVVLATWLLVAARRRRARRRAQEMPAPVPVPTTPPWGLVPPPVAPPVPSTQAWPAATMQAPIAVMTRPGAVCPRCGGSLHDEAAAFCHTCGMPRPR